MKRIVSVILLVMSALTAYSQGVIGENREQPRAVFMSYRSAIAKESPDKSQSENYIDLTGAWRATSSENSETKIVNLPSSFELQGFTEAIYADKAYTFLQSKPKGKFSAPTDKQIVTYMRQFTIPFDYMDKMVCLHIGAAGSAVSVFINGEEVGYSTDSRNPAEFDITKYIQQGVNTIRLVVDRFSEGSYLEDQTGWRFSGINRDIYIFAQPKIRIRDYMVRTTFDPTYKNGLLEAAVLLKTQLLNSHNVTVYYDLFDPQGNLVNQASREITTSMRGEDTVRFTATIQDVKHWNHETPNLYTIMYRVKREGRFTEYVAVKAGFRTVEVRENELLINGKKIKIKGVNYGEFMPLKGNVISKKEMREAIQKMKYAGFNAIRTEYPLSPEFYSLCDEMGMYVCDVANINAQGVGTSMYKGETLANDPAWLEQFLYRVNNVYERNKAHSSVIMWGLGDNAGNGYNMYEAYMSLKTKDQTRPIVYNSAGMTFNSEVYCPDYPNLSETDKLLRGLDGQPVVFSRCKYDPEIWNSDKFQGGFIDSWESPTLKAECKFAQLTYDYKLTKKSDGVVMSHSAQEDIKAIEEQFSPIRIKAIDTKKRIYEITNNLKFTDLEELPITCQLFKNGVLKKIAPLKVKSAVGESVQVKLPKSSGTDEVNIKIGNICNYTHKIK